MCLSKGWWKSSYFIIGVAYLFVPIQFCVIQSLGLSGHPNLVYAFAGGLALTINMMVILPTVYCTLKVLRLHHSTSPFSTALLPPSHQPPHRYVGM